ncbi:hypothetical protein POPTR_012G072101v4 [Populus trichocarpa]|uniref:Nodulin-like domain-containing protein n=1 Tax=Populus trichocarpa TaxID=3694 RepID=A0A3N7GNQ9_POPTR|nr:hypothetical protein POPTR_012G072101v4 [Populus trichocarpa]
MVLYSSEHMDSVHQRFSLHLLHLLSNSQIHSSLSTLDTVSDIGADCGVLSGVLYTSATSWNQSRVRGGPWVVLVAGAIQCFAGYFSTWAAVTGLIPRPPVAAMCLFVFVAAHAQSFFNTADVVTSVRNFRHFSDTAVGIMKGFLGLSGAILIQAYQTIFSSKPSRYLLTLAILTRTK